MGAGATCAVQNHILDGFGDGSAKILSKFIDDEFDLDVVCDEDVVWIRASQVGCGKLFPGFRDPCINDIVPGRLSNPYFVCAALAVASRNNYLKGHFIAYNPYIGCAAIRLWHNARYEVVIIDDRIPCTVNDDGSFLPLYTYCLHGESWCSLLEKGVAKLRGGSYNNLNRNNISDLLVDMTGEYVIDAEIKNKLNNDEPIAVSSHTSRDIEQLQIDLKSMYNDLFNILLARNAAGNVLLCADPITSAFDEQSVVMEDTFPCVILEVKLKKTAGESRINTAADFLSATTHEPKSAMKSRTKAQIASSRQSKRVNFNDPNKASAASTADDVNALPKSSTANKNLAQDDNRYVRIATISSSTNALNKIINVTTAKDGTNTAQEHESALNWTQWFPIDESSDNNLSTDVPLNHSIIYPPVTPMKHSALSMSYSNSNKLAVSADQNTVRKLNHKYKKLQALLENTSGMVAELPTPDAESSSIWMKWSDFLLR